MLSNNKIDRYGDSAELDFRIRADNGTIHAGRREVRTDGEVNRNL